MHWIQKSILKNLSVSDSKRYIELKPPDTEGNLFMYHLDQLQKQNYIEKLDKSYRLSSAGLSYVSGMSLASGTRRIQPKIVVMLFCQNDQQQYLLFKWTRHPYRNLISLPFGKIHYGRPVAELLNEELHYKAGLKGDFKYRGDVYVKTVQGHQALDHFLAHIFEVQNPTGQLESNGLVGMPYWGFITNHLELVPGTAEIISLLKQNKTPFFKEISVAI